MTIDRVALDGGNNPIADPVIVQIEVEYTVNKLTSFTNQEISFEIPGINSGHNSITIKLQVNPSFIWPGGMVLIKECYIN